MNLGDIITRVQRQFGDESEVQITKDDIKRWVNDGQVDITRRTECLQAHSESSAVALDGTYKLPTDFLLMKRVTYDSKPVWPITPELADKFYPNRDLGESTGIPNKYWVWAGVLHLYPPPAVAGTANLDIWYVRTPATLANDGDVPEIPYHMHEDIVRYAFARAKELDEDDAKAASVMSEYEARLIQGRYETNNPQGDSYAAVRLLPGDE
jgi:hypothetical protein